VLVTPGATALTLIPLKEVSNAAHFTSIFNIAIEVEYIIEPGVGASPAVLDNIVTLPIDNLRKGVASDKS
jgi:hypothetical protein